ncbi:hypothetical protein AVEN_35576-1 [Araneus ventricosus]|uniref:RNase H type-1 domain-containing protein n=1 Tax=Araneus ventricosus TaxID=182803 RepID=A0A4Y2CKC1_ARAVE|nr:hypothetical protein AVEN_35576-1 [Araneus ventricosus]
MRMARKLSTIQRSFLLNISGAYSTTATTALQVTLGTAQLHLQLQQESRFINICRFNQPLSIKDLPLPDEIEIKVSSWAFHLSKHLKQSQISLEDGGNSKNFINIYSDGSKTELGVGCAFCVFVGQNITHRWSARLSNKKTAFQAEIIALRESVKFAKNLNTDQVVNIHVDNRARIQAVSNFIKPNKNTPRNIKKILLYHSNIEITWIMAHAGNKGNEVADILAKQAKLHSIWGRWLD